MRLRREQVRFLAGRIVDDLLHQRLVSIERTEVDKVKLKVDNIVLEELLVEDRLNEEVRKILEQYRERMYQEGIDYQEMFKMIKKRLINERNIVI